ncbi:hypothetical protein DESC_830103 [Desulfosarcina cetonica]|nr:hypothetical protein DESC_830103 [Desulfosarcina cetonica]
MVQEGVLLGLVETVDLVHEKNRALALELALLFGFVDDLADLLDTGQHRREVDEVGFGFKGDDARQGGFAAAGRPPQNHGEDAVVLDGVAHQGSRTGDRFLTKKIRQPPGPHALGQRALGIGLDLGLLIEKFHA